MANRRHATLRRVAVAITLVLGALPTPSGMTLAGDTHPTPGPQPLAAAAGDTFVEQDQVGNIWLKVADGTNLDIYTCRDGSPISFQLTTATFGAGINYGPVDADGRPLPGNVLFGQLGQLTLRVFDVDEESGEVDLLAMNEDEAFPDKLTGANEQWSIVTYSINLSRIKLPTAGNPLGINTFDLYVDETQAGWCVTVDWAKLLAGPDLRPIVALHGFRGFSGGGNSAEGIRDGITDSAPRLEGRIIAPTFTDSEGVEANLPIIEAATDGLLATAHSTKTNLIAHSWGSLNARYFAWLHPDQVPALWMLGGPNGGIIAADAGCQFANEAREIPGWGLPIQVFIGLECDDATDGLWQLRRDYVQNTFNPLVVDNPPEVTQYVTLASDCGGCPSNLVIGQLSALVDSITEEPDDGLVPISSAEYLKATDPVHPGTHETRPHYTLTHGSLAARGSRPALDFLCELYFPAGCQIAAGGSQAAPAPAPAPNQLTLPAGQSLAGVFTGARSFPAGATVTQPLAFESTAVAMVAVYAPAGSLIAKVGTTPLVEKNLGTGFSVYELTLNNPANASLVITNTSSAAVGVQAKVLIASARKMAVVAPEAGRMGNTFPVQVSLVGAVAGETPTVSLIDETGTSSAVTITPSGQGAWTGTVTPPHAGSFRILAKVGGASPRSGVDFIAIADGTGRLGTPFQEALVGNEDGLADALRLTVPVTITTAGTYGLSAKLVDSTGAVVARAAAQKDLTANGSIALEFDGSEIFRSTRSGPYRLVAAKLFRPDNGLTIEDERADLGQTAAYNFLNFQHFPVEFDLDGFTDVAIDPNGDTVFEQIKVTGSVRIDTAGTYAINARLLAPDGSELTRFQTSRSLLVGPNSFDLLFSGPDIYAAGKNGPYTVADLSVYATTDLPQFAQAQGYLVTAHQTAAYVVAAQSQWSPSVAVSDSTVGKRTDPSIAALADGTAHAVWTDNRNGTASDIYYARRDPSTGVWSPNQRVNDVQTGTQSMPALAVDSTGTVHAVWTDGRTTPAGVFYSSRSAAGVWSPAVRVSASTAQANWASIASAPNGDLMVTWADFRANKHEAYASRKAAGSSTWSANVKITTSANAPKAFTNVTFAADSRAHAVWMDSSVTGSHYDIFYATAAPGSNTWSAPVRVNDDTGNDNQREPDVAVDASGQLYVSYRDDTNLQPIRVRRKVGSAPWEPSVGLGVGWHSIITARPGGGAAVLWREQTSAYKIVIREQVSGANWTPMADGSDATVTGDFNDATYGGMKLFVTWSGTNDTEIRARVRP